MKYLLALGALTMLVGYAEHRVDTFSEWCEQISGVDLQEKYRPGWAVVFSVSFDGDAIRNDYTAFVNDTHLEMVGDQADRMAWRVGTSLHLVNPASLLDADPSGIVREWRVGIETARNYTHDNADDKCLYGTITSLFDTFEIHLISFDVLGSVIGESVTVIPTERNVRLANPL